VCFGSSQWKGFSKWAAGVDLQARPSLLVNVAFAGLQAFFYPFFHSLLHIEITGKSCMFEIFLIPYNFRLPVMSFACRLAENSRFKEIKNLLCEKLD